MPATKKNKPLKHSRAEARALYDTIARVLRDGQKGHTVDVSHLRPLARNENDMRSKLWQAMKARGLRVSVTKSETGRKFYARKAAGASDR
jgi:hypothetical protein